MPFAFMLVAGVIELVVLALKAAVVGAGLVLGGTVMAKMLKL